MSINWNFQRGGGFNLLRFSFLTCLIDHSTVYGSQAQPLVERGGGTPQMGQGMQPVFSSHEPISG